MRTATFLVTLLCVLGIGVTARGADVTVTLSDQAVYVDIPFNLSLRIDGDQYERPTLPTVAGLEVLGAPSVSSGFQSINGRASTWVDLIYTLVANQPGTLTIPSFDVAVDGETFTVEPMKVRVVATATGDDEVRLRLNADRDTYFVGERIPLTLEIWVQGFVSERYRRTLSAEQLWRRVAKRGSSWGIFASALQSQIDYHEVVEDGVKYFVFEVATDHWPEQTGMLDFDDIRVRVDYPVELREERDFFGRRELRIQSRPIVQRLDDSAIAVESLPLENRPPTFTGAVGQFAFDVTADPLLVAVGDPITLTMTVTDRTPGGSALELVGAPPLDRVETVTRDFRLPSEQPGGVVQGRRKVFTQTVRATTDAVDSVPPIPFAYFDPVARAYAVADSDVIPLMVQAVDSVGLSEVVGAPSGDPARTTELTEVAGGILANYTGAEELLAQQTFRLGWPIVLLLTLPPILFAGASIAHRRVRRLRTDVGYARQRRAARAAERRIAESASAPESERPRQLATAVADYVADRLNLPAGALTAPEVVDRLREKGVGAEQLDPVRSFLDDCEMMSYGGSETTTGNDLVERASGCIGALEREALK